MKKSLVTLSLLLVLFVQVGCDMDSFGDDLLFFYTATVVGGGGTTERTLVYDSDGYRIIMTRWWTGTRDVEGTLLQGEAEALQERTKFTLSITDRDDLLVETGAMYVKKFHDGYEVAQDFTFSLPVGEYILVGKTIGIDEDTKDETVLYTDTVNLRIE